MKEVFIFVFLTIFCSGSTCKEPVVKSELWTIIGKYKTINVFGKEYTVERYLGIPYAEAPIGELRFRKPVPRKRFTEPLRAFSHGSVCYQMNFMRLFKEGLPISEDCLFLNVYVPEVRKENLAVLIWIHGGGFVAGASDPYVSDALAAHGNVVVVTLNYRLSIWGFLSTEDDHAPGNYGLFDQHLAIKWVHDNIQAFGGDPTRVTIFGESAGAASVVYQSIFEGNKGLFQRGIALSGSSASPWSSSNQARNNAKKLGKLVGCTDVSSELLVNCLRQVPADKLFDALQSEFISFPFPFVPWIDGEFVKENPKHVFDSKTDSPSSKGLSFFSELDFMTGICANEGTALISPLTGVMDPVHFEPNKTLLQNDVVPRALSFLLENEGADIIEEIITHEYSDFNDPDNFESTRDGITKIYSDIMFAVPMFKTLHYHGSVAKNTKHRYIYRFAVKPTMGLIPMPPWVKEATHADELGVLFFDESDGFIHNSIDDQGYRPASWESDVAEYMITLWSNFAKTGNPNKPTPVKMFWPAYTEDTQYYLEISRNMTSDSVKSYLHSRGYNFWHNVIPKLYEAVGKKL